MMSYEKQVNALLLDIYDKILVTEEKALRKGSFKDISVAEMHTLEGIGLYGNRTMSETAATLGITTGTLTVAIDRLVRKGYVERHRDQNDRRVVRIQLTKKRQAGLSDAQQIPQTAGRTAGIAAGRTGAPASFGNIDRDFRLYSRSACKIYPARSVPTTGRSSTMSNLSREQIYDDVIRTIAEVAECDLAELNGRTELIADLGLDSLMIFEIVIELEEKFDLRISDEEVDQIKTINQAVDFVLQELVVEK